MNTESYINEMMADVRKKFRNLKQQMPSREIMNAFTKVYRHYFTPTLYDEVDGKLTEKRMNYDNPHPELLKAVYTDTPLAVMIKNNEVISTSSQPFVMAMMLRDGFVAKGMKVLEIGTGSGYNAGIISQITGSQDNVTTVEIHKEITEFALQNFKRAGLEGIHAITDDGGRGYSKNAPYDSIIVTCGAPEIPMHAQVSTGGYISLPLVTRGMETLCSLKKREDGSFEGYLSLFVRFLHFEGIYSDRSQFAKKIGSLQRMMENHGSINETMMSEMSGLLEIESDSPEIRMQKRRKRAAFNMFTAINDDDAVLYESEAEGRRSGYGLWHTETVVANSGFAVMFPNEIVVWGNNEISERLLTYYHRWKDLGEPSLDRYTIEFFPQHVTNTSLGEQFAVKRKNGFTVFAIR